MWILHGNVTERGDVGGGPGKSSLFFLTAYHPEIGLSGARVLWPAEPRTFAGSGSGSLGLGGNPSEQRGTSRATGRRFSALRWGRPWQASAVRRALNDQLRTGTDKGNLTV
ncbi:hypothetical protein N7510_011881 [Penicillium lagena]|nr:hypothetical protein N7510_011887 [Penicillium lagena]KAJ5597187.1 hypothetical protein N7510_011893 [Penicillium lagena]KAJ5597201.1 hypothetical protein N7510_011907 [Penicillium lagena]KAJ5598913.1 hypothetical protein N7510_011863 [Penicillium lagena]KAJ5598919.1 hypothetical protein N7510_011869 [Penicillium lagena]